MLNNVDFHSKRTQVYIYYIDTKNLTYFFIISGKYKRTEKQQTTSINQQIQEK